MIAGLLCGVADRGKVSKREAGGALGIRGEGGGICGVWERVGPGLRWRDIMPVPFMFWGGGTTTGGGGAG